MKKFFKENLPKIGVFLVFFVFLIDQTIKYKIRSLGGFYICNKGVSFGIHVPDFVFLLILGLIGVFIGVYFSGLFKKCLKSAFLILGAGLFIGGAFSNIIDRLFFGCVFDYISIFKIFFPIFNLADVSLFIGTALIFYSLIKR